MTTKTQLIEKIAKTEEKLIKLEIMVGKRDFETEFMKRIEKEFRPYMDMICSREAFFHGDPLLSDDDLKQDVLEYIYRYTMGQARKRWAAGEVWFPYVKRSIFNCFVNIRKSRKNWHKKLNLASFDITDFAGADKRCQRPEGQDNVEFNEYCSEILAMLDEEEQMIFNEMLEPSNGFSQYIRKTVQPGGEARATRRMVADYFGISYSRVLAIFKKFQGCVDFCVSAT